MTEIELAWCAGLFDGEGCISIAARMVNAPNRADQQRRTPQYRLMLSLSMTHKATIERFHQLIGVGSMQYQCQSKYAINANDAYRWSVGDRNAGQVAAILRPYLFTKAAEADVAIEFCELTHKRPGRGGVPPEEFRKRIELSLKIRALKPSNRFRTPKYNEALLEQLPPLPPAEACIHGHPLSGDNLYTGPEGRRECRTCMRARDRERRPGDFSRTVCKNGHTLEGDNVYVGRHGALLCRTCQKEAATRQWAKRKSS